MVKTICGNLVSIIAHGLNRGLWNMCWKIETVLTVWVYVRRNIILPHSFVKIWMHAIWATREREPLVNLSVETLVHEYRHRQFIELGCPVRIINRMADHVHSLFLLNPKISMAVVIKQVKGSSSHYVNEQNISVEKFVWQS